MQIIKVRGEYVEKILRDREGRLLRAKFFVYENAGRMKARLVDFTYIQELAHNVVFTLSGFVKKVSYFIKIFTKFSSFIQGSTLYFLGSKPRAPTL